MIAGGAEGDCLAVRYEHGRPARMAVLAEAVHEQPVPAADKRADSVVHQKSIRRRRGKGFIKRGKLSLIHI